VLLDTHTHNNDNENVPATGSARFDLAGAQTDGQVGNVIVLRFTAAVTGHDAPPVLLGQFDGVDTFTNGTDLVDLEEQTVGGLALNRLRNLFRIGHRQVVADNLDLVADRRRDPTRSQQTNNKKSCVCECGSSNYPLIHSYRASTINMTTRTCSNVPNRLDQTGLQWSQSGIWQ
jgi:hypothetical protein